MLEKFSISIIRCIANILLLWFGIDNLLLCTQVCDIMQQQWWLLDIDINSYFSHLMMYQLNM